MIPAMSWAVPPKAMARGITTGSPAAGNRPALTLLKRTVVSPKPIRPSGAGFAVSAMKCLPATTFCLLNPSGLRTEVVLRPPPLWALRAKGRADLSLVLDPRHPVARMAGATTGQLQLQDHG